MENKTTPTASVAKIPKKKRGIKNLGTKILSVVLSIVCWVAVATTDSTGNFPTSIEEVPISTESQEETLAKMGLSIIEMTPKTVTAKVQGNRATIGKLTPAQLAAAIKPNVEVSGPGEYEFTLTPSNENIESMGSLYSIGGYYPETIKVKLDRLETRTFTPVLMLSGSTATPEGFIREPEVLTPAKIVVTGPREQLEKVSRCVVAIDLTAPLSKTLMTEVPVTLLDAQGEEINLDDKRMTLDASKVQVTIQVLKKAELPLEIQFINLPRGLDEVGIPYTMSNYEVAVAGPAAEIDRYQEIVLDYIDLKDLSVENNAKTYPIELPTGFTNLESLNEVTVSFDSSGWEEKTVTILGDNIRVLNAPKGYAVTVTSASISGVKMVGRAEDINNLVADNVIAEIDLADRELSGGEHQFAVKISALNSGVVWAFGSYTVVLEMEDAGT